MKIIIGLIILLNLWTFNNHHSLAKKCYIVKNTKNVDSSYLQNILFKIYKLARKGELKSYKDISLNQILDTNQVKFVGDYCEVVNIAPADSDCGIDSLVCFDAEVSGIETFCISYPNLDNNPKSLSIEFYKINYPEAENRELWIEISKLNKILPESELKYLIESQKHLPNN